MTKWSIELSQFEISFETREALKAHVFTYFNATLTPTTKKPYTKGTVAFTDGSSNNMGSNVSLILKNDERLVVKVSLWFLYSTTNNQAEYDV
jgi:hypothetical protein